PKKLQAGLRMLVIGIAYPSGVSTLLCKRPGFGFWDGCAREGAASLPSPSDVERFWVLMTQLSPGPAFVPATESRSGSRLRASGGWAWSTSSRPAAAQETAISAPLLR